MTGWGRVTRCSAAAIGAAALLAGCNSGGGGTSAASSSQASATSTMAAAAPTSFDGCKLPQSVIDAEHFDSDPTNSNMDANGGIKFRGCIWVVDDGFSVSVRTTNMTVQMIEGMSDYKVAERLTVDGRQAVTYHTSGDADLRADCIMNVEMTGGGLDLSVDNPASGKATGTQDSCQIAQRIAGEIVATPRSSSWRSIKFSDIGKLVIRGGEQHRGRQ